MCIFKQIPARTKAQIVKAILQENILFILRLSIKRGHKPFLELYMIWNLIGSMGGKILDIVSNVVEDIDEANRLKFQIQIQLLHWPCASALLHSMF